jgi:hypothetical protein
MSGSGSNKLTNVLGASAVGSATVGVIAGKNSSKAWVFVSIGITLMMAVIAIVLKIASKRAR